MIPSGPRQCDDQAARDFMGQSAGRDLVESSSFPMFEYTGSGMKVFECGSRTATLAATPTGMKPSGNLDQLHHRSRRLAFVGVEAICFRNISTPAPMAGRQPARAPMQL